MDEQEIVGADGGAEQQQLRRKKMGRPRKNVEPGADGQVEETTTIEDVIKETAKEACVVETVPAVKEWCGTGCTILDLAISNLLKGGIPIGRIVHVYGGSSTAKSVLAAAILGYAQRNGKQAYMADVEHTLDPNFAKLYGLNCDDNKTFKLGYPVTLEEMFDNFFGEIIYEKDKNGGLKKDKFNLTPKVVAVDSVTALPSMKEQEETMSEGGFGATRAKQMSKGFRKYIFPLASSNTTLFMIDQTRDNINAMFGGKKEVTSGGRALEFYSSVGIYLQHDKDVEKTVKGKKVTIGIWVKFKIEKNKVAPPLRSGRFKLIFDYGIDDIASNIYFIAENLLGPEKAKDTRTKVTLFGQEASIQEWTSIIEEGNLEEDLRKEVVKLWEEKYRMEPRKQRTW